MKKIDSEYSRQLCILIIIALTITTLFTCRLLSHVEMKSDMSNKIKLLWNGDKLELALSDEKSNTKEKINPLPAHLSPLFFQPIPINSADHELLLTVPGIGPKLASEILRTKNSKGKYHNAEDLLMVSGIGMSKMNNFSRYFSFR